MRQTHAVHLAIKKALRARSHTYADVAKVLEISEASVKRLFSRDQLSLERIEMLCDWMNIDFIELADLSRETEQRITQLTLDQESTLLTDPRLFLLAYMLVNHWSQNEIQEVFEFDDNDMTRLLVQLDRMGLIELLPQNRVRLLTARNFSWNPRGPIQRYFLDTVLREYMQSNFSAPEEKMAFVSGMLSRASVIKVHEFVEELLRKFDNLIYDDLSLPASERYGVSLLACVRPWEFSLFTNLRRDPVSKKL